MNREPHKQVILAQSFLCLANVINCVDGPNSAAQDSPSFTCVFSVSLTKEVQYISPSFESWLSYVYLL